MRRPVIQSVVRTKIRRTNQKPLGAADIASLKYAKYSFVGDSVNKPYKGRHRAAAVRTGMTGGRLASRGRLE